MSKLSERHKNTATLQVYSTKKQTSILLLLAIVWEVEKLFVYSKLKTYLLMRGLSPDVMSLARPTWVYLLDFGCSGIQLYIRLSPYLCFNLFSV